MKIEFKNNDLDILVHDIIRHKSINVLQSFIEELKYRQKRFVEADGTIQSGFELLNDAHQQGIIRTPIFLKIYEVLKNPNIPYEIVIKDEKDSHKTL